MKNTDSWFTYHKVNKDGLDLIVKVRELCKQLAESQVKAIAAKDALTDFISEVDFSISPDNAIPHLEKARELLDSVSYIDEESLVMDVHIVNMLVNAAIVTTEKYQEQPPVQMYVEPEATPEPREDHD